MEALGQGMETLLQGSTPGACAGGGVQLVGVGLGSAPASLGAPFSVQFCLHVVKSFALIWLSLLAWKGIGTI